MDFYDHFPFLGHRFFFFCLVPFIFFCLIRVIDYADLISFWLTR